MEKVKLLDERTIRLPEEVQKRFELARGTEFGLFFDSETIYLKRVFKPVKEIPFREMAKPFREMAKKERLKREDVADQIKQQRKRR